MEQKNSWSANILYMLAWLICSLLVIVDILSIREATLDIMTAVQLKRIEQSAVGEQGLARIDTGYTMTAIDQGILFMGGVVAVVLAIAIEYYFRIGKEKGILLRRIGIVLGIQIAILILCIAIQTFV